MENIVSARAGGQKNTSVIERNPSSKKNEMSSISAFSQGEKIINIINGSRKNFAVITAFLSVLMIVVVISLWASSSSYKQLYGAQEPYNNSAIINVLEAEGISYKMQPETGVILVEDGRVSEIRMLLAAKGIKAELPEGLTILNKESTLGTSQFIEKARYNHGLEGELAKTIMSLNAINKARVHLAIPKENLFVGRSKTKATASVYLDVKGGESLSDAQILSIVNLVAGSVNNLQPESISVTDQSGRLLSDDIDNKDNTRASSKQSDFKESIERQIKKQAQSMLLPILGIDNFRIESSADIDFSKREETKESFETPVLLTQTVKNENDFSELAIGIPGSLSTTPPLVDGDPDIKTPNKQRTRHQSDSKYAIGSSITHTQFQQGVINNISLSVVINEDIAPEGGWQAEDFGKIKAMLVAAVGSDLERGDNINITSFTFSPIQSAMPVTVAWYEETYIQSLLKIIASAIVALALVFSVLRPLMKHITGNNNTVKDDDLLAELAPAHDVKADKEKEFTERLKEYGVGDINDRNDIEELMLPSPDSPLNVQIQHLQLTSKEQPDRVSEILKNWINA
ncbi:flagellar basal-body MS-ring/collar protein FliF [Psychromonas sp. Urea-02u-13]|uniref:flagellar basal-body MS-ring/collar protein FliF n=1 Tax=Psychromonas sp. Urea-02u-13 TaxID=2058326 RepID=UPI000C34D93C|nr:flagellar basal-body MS-ring/collar protein FliF [Psychromonas sp. Urea-02u-13]PKG39539.1 flagellar M-ring protein FliF [Psychromonas sp. Urea-02u-13]